MTPQEIAEKMCDLFAGSTRWHGTHGAPDWDAAKSKWGIRQWAKTLVGEADAALWLSHLEGREPLGVVPVRLTNERTVCRWGCCDVDDYDVDAVMVIRKVQQMGYPLVPCRSKSNGLHLFLFLKEWEDPAAVQAVLGDMAASMGLAKCEIFPKQTRLVDGRDKGSWIVMPYFGGDYEGRLALQYGLKASGSDMTVEEFIRAAEAARTTTGEITVKRAPRPVQRAQGSGAARAPRVPFGDGPPCLEHLAEQGVQPGGRDSALFMMGIYLKKADPENWRARLEEANARWMQPPGDAAWLMGKIASLEKKDYQYTCSAEPMRSHCNSRLCRGRQYGVGEVGEIPRITHLVQKQTDPVQWLVQLAGVDVRLEMSSADFHEYRKFRAKAFSSPPSVNFAPMKEADWSAMITAAMHSVMDVITPEQLPTEETKAFEFCEMFRLFTSGRAYARTKEEMDGRRGKVWEDKEGEVGEPGRWYFRLVTMRDFVHETGGFSWPVGYYTKMFRELGGKNKDVRINRTVLSIWGFPPDAVQRPEPRAVRRHEEEKI